jgi:hypothetical protein
MLLTGLPWRLVPEEIGCSGVTAWGRLRDWQAVGVDWSVGVDGSHIRALRGGR